MYKNITFQNISATTQAGKRAGLIWGLPEAPAAGIVLQNVIITADNPLGIFNAQGVRLENCKIRTVEGVNKLTLTNAQVFVDGKEAR